MMMMTLVRKFWWLATVIGVLIEVINGDELIPCIPSDVSLAYLMPFASQLPPATQSFLQTLNTCTSGQKPCLPAHIEIPEHIRMLLPKHMQRMPTCVDKEKPTIKTGARLGDDVAGDWYDDIEKDMMDESKIPEYSAVKKQRSCPTNCTCQSVPGHCEWLIDCRGLDLDRMPDNVDADTDCIDIGDNNITLANLFLDTLPYYLTHLELSFNPLGIDKDGNRVELPGHLFEFPKLYVLGLSSCNISSISEHAFIGLSNLTVLQMSDNALTTLPPTLLHPIPTLKMLLLDRNNIRTLPAQFFKAQTDLLGVIMHGNNFSAHLIEQWKQADSAEFLQLGIQNVNALKQWDIDFDTGDDILNDLLMRGPGADKNPEMEKYIRTLQAAVDKVKAETTAEGRDDIASMLTGLRSMDPEFWQEMIRTELKNDMSNRRQTGDADADGGAASQLNDETLRAFFEAMNVDVDKVKNNNDNNGSNDDEEEEEEKEEEEDAKPAPPPPPPSSSSSNNKDEL